VQGICGSTVVATGQANAYAIAVDDSNVYWTTSGNSGAILQAPVGGGGAIVLVSGSGQYPAGIAIDAHTVYWSNEIPGGGVLGVPIGGGSPKTLAGNLDTPLALFVSQGTLYFTLDPYQNPSGGGVMSVPLSGGTPTTIASGDNQPMSIAVGGGMVFWTDATDVMAAPVGGGAPITFAAQTYPYSVATDGSSVYFTSGLGGGAVFRQSISSGSRTALASNQYYPNAIVTDGTSVYWTTGQGGAGTVSKIPAAGGTPVALASSQAYPTSLALNSTRLFWVDFGDGTIRSVPK
jgi:hypothetical protein